MTTLINRKRFLEWIGLLRPEKINKGNYKGWKWKVVCLKKFWHPAWKQYYYAVDFVITHKQRNEIIIERFVSRNLDYFHMVSTIVYNYESELLKQPQIEER